MHHIVNPVKQFSRKKPNQKQQTTYKTTHIFADVDIWTTPQEKRKKERKEKKKGSSQYNVKEIILLYKEA